ncbi:MAG: GNAT family N-acetyltransferase, partial [Thermoflavifilum sp.]|nr:GNAT family N-acetyltransferase [Thermoflavifilum sp.]MCL6515240.1 GNAT family N-acetyltransferase [Alicyclobacillus sp.]
MTRVVLRDGRVAELRPARRDAADKEMIRRLFAEASPDSLYFRFFHVVREVPEKLLEAMLEANGDEQYSLLCIAGDRALGIGTYARTDDDTAEVAFFVADEMHGKGLGTLLLEHLAQTAWRHGFKRFEAYVLCENRRMLSVFQSSGFEIRRRLESDRYHLVLPLVITERVRALQDTREKLAVAASLAPVFQPQTVAVVGASRDPDSLGHQLLRHIVDGGFQGTVYPVNPHARAVAGVQAHPSLRDIPEPVDLAVIAVPAAETLGVVDDAVASGVRAVVIISAGFADAGDDGLALEREVRRRLRAAGCRLIGPNCLGLLTTAPQVRLNASFVPYLPRAGGLAVASQSGGLGVAIVDYAQRVGLGISNFVSMGNKADVSTNDLLQYWEDDAQTEMVALYIESFGNPRKFSRIARRISRKKPVLVVKSARSPVSLQVSDVRQVARAARDIVVEALFRQTGLIRIDTLQELFDVAPLLAFSPRPTGRRVAIVTNSAGGAVMAVDALRREGLEFVQPVVDLGFEALAEGYRLVLPQVLRDPAVDAVLVLYVPVGRTDTGPVADAIRDAVREVVAEGEDAGKPVIANFLTTETYHVRLLDAGGQKVPVYPFPEQAVRALAKAVQYAEYLAQPQGRVPDLVDIDTEAARAMVRRWLRDGYRVLRGDEALEVLAKVGVHGTQADEGDERESEAADTGGSRTRADGGQGSGAGALAERARTRQWRGAVSVESDPLFGPVLTVRRDAARGPDQPPQMGLRLIPITDLDADSLAWAAAPEPEAEALRAQLQDLVLRLSRFVDETPEVAGLELRITVRGGQDAPEAAGGILMDRVW